MVSDQPVSCHCSLDENHASEALSPPQQLVESVMGCGVQEKLESCLLGGKLVSCSCPQN